MNYRLLLVATSCALTLSCSNKQTGPPPRKEVGSLEMRLALLKSANALQTTQHAALIQELSTLEEVVKTTEFDPEAAKSAWKRVAEVEHRLDSLQVGPAGPPAGTLGGQGIRDEIYSWPLVNPCRVDQVIVDKTYEDATQFAALAVNVRGIDALEYLIFVDTDDNACPPNLAINTDGSWTALSSVEIRARRNAMTKAVTNNIKAQTLALDRAWKNGFSEELTDPQNGSVYGSTREAINAISNAMFFLDVTTKDLKLAVPAGISNCATSTCPEQRESKFANASIDAIRANVIGFDLAYHGGERDDEDAIGFDDLLGSIDATDLNVDMVGRIDAVYQKLDALEGTMFEALANNPDQVVAVHTAIRSLTDLMKTQFVSVLDLDLPQRAEGDND